MPRQQRGHIVAGILNEKLEVMYRPLRAMAKILKLEIMTSVKVLHLVSER